MSEPSDGTSNLSRSRFYSPQLDGLRFVAALLVFVDHAPRLPGKWLQFCQARGWVGVDIFLALSAFLITRLILIEHDRTGSLSLPAFYARRALRIWPLYWAYATLMCLWGFHKHFNVRLVLEWWASHITLTNNLLTAISGWSFVPFSWHLWTISLEEQAYLLLPPLILLVITTAARRRTLVSIAIASLLLLLAVRFALFLSAARPIIIYVTPLRSDAFILGALAAVLVHRRELRGSPLWVLPGLILLASPAAFLPIYELSWYHVFGYLLTACGATGLVLGLQAPSLASRFLATRPLPYLGKISYGIYVFHLAGIGVGDKAIKKFGIPNLAAFALALFITILLAAASYSLWERPWLLMKKRFERVPSRPV